MHPNKKTKDMIQEFQVQNFFSIRERQSINFLPTNDDKLRSQYLYEVSEDIKLLKIGIVYGSNASGKTTLLDALTFFRHTMLDKPESKNFGMGFMPFLLDNHSQEEHSFMQMTFWLNKEKYVLSLEFDKKRIYKETLLLYSSSRPTTLYKRSYQLETDHTEVTFGSKSGISKPTQRAIAGNTTNNCSVMAAIRRSNAATSRLNIVADFFFTGMQDTLTPRDTLAYFVKDELLNDKDGKKKRFLLQMFKATDFNITDCIKNGDDIFFRHTGEDGEYMLNERLESAGTHRFLGMSVVLYYALRCNSFITIDEVETSIHYELLSYFIKLFLANSEGSSQLLMTPHDINLLNEDYIRRDVVWFTDKTHDGATLLKRLSSLGLHKSMSPYHAYKQGKLVDLPFLGSIYLDKEE